MDDRQPDNTELTLLRMLAEWMSGEPEDEAFVSEESESKGCSSDELQNEDCVSEKLETAERARLISMARAHAVLPLISDRLDMGDAAASTLYNSHRILYLTARYLHILDEAGIKAVVLKGWAVAPYYRVPELRKMGDIDLLVAESEITRAVEVLVRCGFKTVEEQHANHHVELSGPDGVSVEIHNTLVEAFDDDAINEKIRKYGQEILKHYEETEYHGYKIRRPKPAYNALSLMLHMLQHYMRAGFGLKLLCDWVVYINGGIDREEYKKFSDMAASIGITGFVDVINEVCVRYLGMKRLSVVGAVDVMDGSGVTGSELRAGEGADKEKTAQAADTFIMDILDGEEFGRSTTDRMVVLNGSGLSAYVKEFHHQMRLNNPHSSKCVLLWPYLWCKTLVVFMRNNKVVRKTTAREIFKNAGARGRLVKDMELFDVKPVRSDATSIEQALENNIVKIKPTGYSMYPVIVPGRDYVYLEKVDASRVKRGDVILYRRRKPEEILVLHRVYKVKKDGIYTVGDNQTAIEGPLDGSQVLAKMDALERKGKAISTSNIGYRLLTGIWLWLRPVRRPISLAVHALRKKKITRKK